MGGSYVTTKQVITAFPGLCWGIRGALLIRSLLPGKKQQWDVPQALYLSDSKSVCSSNSTMWRFSLCLRTSLVGFQNVSVFPFFSSFISTSPSWEGKIKLINGNQKNKAEINPDKLKLLLEDDKGYLFVRRLLSSSRGGNWTLPGSVWHEQDNALPETVVAFIINQSRKRPGCFY